MFHTRKKFSGNLITSHLQVLQLTRGYFSGGWTLIWKGRNSNGSFGKRMPWKEMRWFGLFIHIKQDPNQTQREWRSHSGPCRLSKTEEGWDCRIPKPRLQISPHPGTFSDFTSQVGLKCPNKIGQLYFLTAVSTITLFMSQLLKYCMVVKALQCSCMSGWHISLLSQ